MSAHDSEIPTADPEQEPEFVGAHGALHATKCQNWVDAEGGKQKCGKEATHTIVWFTGRYHAVARCDECGEPEEAEDGRLWTGELTDIQFAGGETDG